MHEAISLVVMGLDQSGCVVLICCVSVCPLCYFQKRRPTSPLSALYPSSSLPVTIFCLFFVFIAANSSTSLKLGHSMNSRLLLSQWQAFITRSHRPRLARCFQLAPAFNLSKQYSLYWTMSLKLLKQNVVFIKIKKQLLWAAAAAAAAFQCIRNYFFLIISILTLVWTSEI